MNSIEIDPKKNRLFSFEEKKNSDTHKKKKGDLERKEKWVGMGWVNQIIGEEKVGYEKNCCCNYEYSNNNSIL